MPSKTRNPLFDIMHIHLPSKTDLILLQILISATRPASLYII
jgi:hypothetical protein